VEQLDRLAVQSNQEESPDRAGWRAPIWVFGALYVVLFGAVILLSFRLPPIRR